MDGAQGIGSHRRHQPDHCRLRRRDNLHCHFALTYWADEPAHAVSRRADHVEADVLVKLAHAQMLARRPEMDLTEAWLVASGY